MARVRFVQKARRPLPSHGIEIGDSYYWWSLRIPGQLKGRKFFSKTQPRQSQLTQSDFLSTMYQIQEQMQDAEATSREDLETMRDDWVSQINDLAQETRDKLDNMPEGLKAGPTGTLLEERADSMDSWASEIEGVELPDRENDENDADYQQRLQDALDEIRNIDPGM